MKRMAMLVISALLIPVIASGKDVSKQLSVDTIQVLKIAGQDECAVIKTPDGKMQIIKVGDPIGEHAKVTEIVPGRVVIEEKKGNVTEKVIITLDNDKQHVERLKKDVETHSQAYASEVSREPSLQKPSVQEKQPTEVKKEKRNKKENKEKQKKKNKKAQEKKADGEKYGIENSSK